MGGKHVLHNSRKWWKRIGAMIIAPILFLVIGYSLLYVIGQPVIQLVSSSVELFMLSEPPNFETQVAASTTTATTTQTTKTKETPNKKESTSKKTTSAITYPKSGENYGTVKIPDLGVEEPLYYGDTREILRLGAGQYMGSVYPGEVGTTLIGAHNNTTFNHMLVGEAGTKIILETTYGTFTYEVEKREIKNYQDKEILNQLNQKERKQLILYTCYPIYSIGMTQDRIFVTAKMIDSSMN